MYNFIWTVDEIAKLEVKIYTKCAPHQVQSVNKDDNFLLLLIICFCVLRFYVV